MKPKEFIYKNVPALYEIRKRAYFNRLMHDWLSVCHTISAGPQLAPGHYLIVPADPASILDSRGDEAMVRAAIDQILKVNSDATIGIVAENPVAESAVRSLGCEVISHPKGSSSAKQIVELLNSFRAEFVFVIGADQMDGYYSQIHTLVLIMFADLATRLGARTTILGFSFNDRCNSALKPAFEQMHRGVIVCCRDPLSYKRLTEFANVNAKLVADSAFIFDGSRHICDQTYTHGIIDWISLQQRAGKRVIGYNFHARLATFSGCADTSSLLDAFVSALVRLCTARTDISLIAVPHDFIKASHEVECLHAIDQKLAEFGVANRLFIDRKLSAGDLKHIASKLNGVISSRMHLAIGALGTGVPVLGVTYQDKFEGQFQHFDLPDWLLVDPSVVLQRQAFLERLVRFVDELESLRKHVGESLPLVKEKALRNYSVLLN